MQDDRSKAAMQQRRQALNGTLERKATEIGSETAGAMWTVDEVHLLVVETLPLMAPITRAGPMNVDMASLDRAVMDMAVLDMAEMDMAVMVMAAKDMDEGALEKDTPARKAWSATTVVSLGTLPGICIRKAIDRVKTLEGKIKYHQPRHKAQVNNISKGKNSKPDSD